MASEADVAAQRLLDELAQLSLATARDLSAAIHDTDDPGQMIGLAEAYAKVGRCLRVAVALAMRLRRGEGLAPATRDRDSRDLEPEVERDESVFIEERPERLDDRENLFDRLPSGDLDTQIAAVARSLASATRVLPPAAAGGHRARCKALITEARRLQPARPDEAPPDDTWPGPAQADLALARPRGPPRRLN